MNHAKRSKISSLAALTALAALTIASSARASERESAAHCFLQPEFSGVYRWQDGIANLSSGLGWTPLSVFCPITVDDSSFKKADIDQVYVSYLDGNNQFGAIHNFHVNVCLTAYTGTASPICFGDRELNPGTATGGFWTPLPSDMTSFLATTSPWAYANLVVTIPASNGWPSALRGIEVFR